MSKEKKKKQYLPCNSWKCYRKMEECREKFCGYAWTQVVKKRKNEDEGRLESERESEYWKNNNK